MQVMMAIFEPEASFAKRADPAHMGAWMAYVETVAKAGIMVGGHGLQPPATAATITIKDGRRQVQDGPFVETKEMLGGYFIFEVPDMETALDWASRCPLTDGTLELRPVLPKRQEG